MARYEISKDFTFSASHQLYGLDEGHPCGRLHGHNYVVRVLLRADELDKHGFVMDYGRLAPFGAWIDGHLDHRHLNEVPPFGLPPELGRLGLSQLPNPATTAAWINPTAESLAQHLHDVLWRTVPVPPAVRATVAVSETGKTWASYDLAGRE